MTMNTQKSTANVLKRERIGWNGEKLRHNEKERDRDLNFL
jgi:hypothetical protein